MASSGCADGGVGQRKSAAWVKSALAPTATHLALNVGGNDALGCIRQLITALAVGTLYAVIRRTGDRWWEWERMPTPGQNASQP
jgi:hypothetical protein